MGLPPLVTRDDIKHRYHELARRYHPDLNGKNTNEDMERINEAYELLKDYIDKYRFSFDDEEIARQDPEKKYSEQFKP